MTESDYERGYQAGREAMKREILEHMQVWLSKKNECNENGSRVAEEKKMDNEAAELRAREFVEKLCCKDPRTGEKYGCGRVLDYIGVPWEDNWRSSSEIKGQMSFWDFPEMIPEEMRR